MAADAGGPYDGAVGTAERRGFSLVETMIGMSLTFLIAMMVTLTLPGATRGVAAADDEVHAAEVGAGMLRMMESRGFDQLPVGVYDGRVPDPPEAEGTSAQVPPSPYPSVSRTVVEGDRSRALEYHFVVETRLGTDRTANPADDLKQVTVTVHWERVSASGGRFPRSLVLSTLVAEP